MRATFGEKLESITLKSVDFFLLMVVLVLVFFGLIMVFSASYYYSISQADTPFSYLIRDGIWVVIGLFAMLLGLLFDYHIYCNKWVAIGALIFCFLLLILVLSPFGQEINGAQRWIAIGPITLMPGEIAKIGLIFFIAWFYGTRPRRADSLLLGLLPVFVIMGVFAALIFKQPNLSTAITVCCIVVAMQLVAGMHWGYIAFLGALGGAGLAALLSFAADSYWVTRITSFLDPFADAAGEGYQVVQSLLALGSGGLFGVGMGKSVQKSLYLPEPQNDFILAIIGEELGFVGVLALLLVYCLFIWRGTRIALRAPDQFGLLLASGIVLMVAIQVVLNVAVVTSSMPPTGINLPFVSYGGNALLMFMFASGVLLNISRQIPKDEDELLELENEK
ncbi:MAG: putative lipid II flippase FtsW [Firmicutes bacterium]|nr:putative lipid II flippase FtsW [Bacillota bacterium]